MGEQLSDVASAVSAADRRGMAGVEDGAGSGGGVADHAEDERFGDVAGAVERGEYADEQWVVEWGPVYFCWWFDYLDGCWVRRTI